MRKRAGAFCVVLCSALALLACGGPDAGQLRICERLIPALEGEGTAIEIVRRELAVQPQPTARIHYRRTGTAGANEHWIACRFGGAGLEIDRLNLEGVASDRAGELSPVQVFLLRHYWLDLYEQQGREEAETGGRAGALSAFLYPLQLAVHALSLGAIYGLLGIGYTLVYAIIGRINLAFGQIAMLGAYTTFTGAALLTMTAAGAFPAALLLILLVVAALGALQGIVIDQAVFRPLRRASSQAPLVATIGLALFLEEAVRLAQGSSERWLQPAFPAVHEIAGGSGFAVTISSSQIALIALAALLYGSLWALMQRSRFGRAVRACADDVGMAALCGVNVDRAIALTFALGSAYAAAAGFITLLRYGALGFHDGYLLGFKALSAAIVGGIGSIPGAMAGGLLIGALETFWAGYFAMGYKDIAVFALLALTLILRPNGLLGSPAQLASTAARRELA